ncbi:MAG: EAL domain-containing protein [Mariprofundales bacterium]
MKTTQNAAAKRMLPFWQRLAPRFVLSLSLILLVTMLLGAWSWFQMQKQSLIAQEVSELSHLATGLGAGLQTLMLTGQANLVYNWLKQAQQSDNLQQVNVIRRDGREAFRDEHTLIEVNTYLGADTFLRPILPERQVDNVNFSDLVQAVAGKTVSRHNVEDATITLLLPIKTQKECMSCHGYEDADVRGILRVTASVADLSVLLEEKFFLVLRLVVLIVIILGLLLYVLVYTQMLRPLQNLTMASRRLVHGDFSTLVPATGAGELRMLAEDFNSMSDHISDSLRIVEQQKQYYRHTILDHLHDGVITYNAELRIKYANATMQSITGYSEAELLQGCCTDFCADSIGADIVNRETNEHACCNACVYKKAIKTAKSQQAVMNRIKKGGMWQARVALVPVIDPKQGNVLELIEISEDITADEQRKRHLQWLTSIPEKNPSPIIELNEHGEIRYNNPATHSYLQNHDLPKDNINAILPEGFTEAVRMCRLQNAALDTVAMQVGNDMLVWQLHPNDNNAYVRAYAIDVTYHIAANKRVMRNRLVDSTTGLQNRHALLEYLEDVIHQAKNTSRLIALFYIEIDNFNKFNEQYGREFCDILLRKLARLLQNILRKEDMVFRVGGDKFAALPTYVKMEEDALHIASNLLYAVNNESINILEHEVWLSLSIGISFYPRHCDNAEGLLHVAELAKHTASDSGGGCYQMYVATGSDSLSYSNMERELRHALEVHDLLLYFQPMVNPKNSKVYALEVSLRWQHSSLGLIHPGSFMPLAIESGLVLLIGDWLLQRICYQLSLWDAEDFPMVNVILPLSLRQLQHSGLYDSIVRISSKYNIAPQRLYFQLSDDIFSGNHRVAEQLLHKLSSLGVRFSLQQLNLSYKFLGHLLSKSVHILQLQASAVHITHSDDKATRMVRAMIDLAHDLGMEVVANDVKTREQWSILADNGCDILQGELLLPPVSKEHIISVIKRGIMDIPQ